MTCRWCKGTGVYVGAGMNEPEPCLECQPKPPDALGNGGGGVGLEHVADIALSKPKSGSVRSVHRFMALRQAKTAIRGLLSHFEQLYAACGSPERLPYEVADALNAEFRDVEAVAKARASKP